MADRGVKIFGVETISPDLVYLTDEYPTHRACAERRLTHYENLNNLKDVVNQRFLFVGLPAAARASPTARRSARPRSWRTEMSQTLLNRTTATKDNALTEAERDAFLTELRVGRLASNRGDGWSHLTPIWYVWEDGKFILSLGKSRRHLRNIAADPHVTLCVDEDPRTTDLTKSPRAGRLLRARDARRGRGGRPRGYAEGGGPLPRRRRRARARGAPLVRGPDRGRDRARSAGSPGTRASNR